MSARLFVLTAAICGLAATATATEKYDPFTRPFDKADLVFVDQAQTDEFVDNTVLKPDGAGPFPALVLMPTCNGGLARDVWAKGAIERGYAVLIVDPLTPRGIKNNCDGPLPVPMGRLLKDAFDAAEYLRKEPFVDPERVGLMGFSQGGMVGLAASGEVYSKLGGRPPFRVMAVAYPICVFEHEKHPTEDRIVDIVFMPAKVILPILLEMGERDKESGKPMNGCKELVDRR